MNKQPLLSPDYFHDAFNHAPYTPRKPKVTTPISRNKCKVWEYQGTRVCSNTKSEARAALKRLGIKLLKNVDITEIAANGSV